MLKCIYGGVVKFELLSNVNQEISKVFEEMVSDFFVKEFQDCFVDVFVVVVNFDCFVLREGIVWKLMWWFIGLVFERMNE